MGTWGYKLFENDVSMDLKETFDELNRKGIVSEERLLQDYSDMLSSPDFEESQDCADFWLALAKIEWDYGFLSEQTRESALSCLKLENNPGWTKENCFDLKQINKRKNELDLFHIILLSDNPKPKKLHPPRKLFTTPLKKGYIYARPVTDDGGTTSYNIFQVVGIRGCEEEYEDRFPIIKVLSKKFRSIPAIDELKGINPLPCFYTYDSYESNEGINDDGKCYIRYSYCIIDRSANKYRNIEEIGFSDLLFPISIDEVGDYAIFWDNLDECVDVMRSLWSESQISKALETLKNHPCG